MKLIGRKTDILLRTMNEEKSVSTYKVSGLEVSSLSGEEFIDLPDVFTQRSVPVEKENIPQQKDLERWTYLKDINLPQIKANIRLLIGANVPKAMESWAIRCMNQTRLDCEWTLERDLQSCRQEKASEDNGKPQISEQFREPVATTVQGGSSRRWKT